MPLAGFLGFPVFALDCFVVYQSLVLVRVAIAPETAASGAGFSLRRRRTLMAAATAALFSLAVLFGMDRWNTDSLLPRLDDFWIAGPAARARLVTTPYEDLFVLARAEPGEVAAVAGAPAVETAEWIAAAQLATLRGIGTANAQLMWSAGIRSVTQLAAADPEVLGTRLRSMATRPRAATQPRVRVWVKAAQRAAEAPPAARR